MPPIFYHYADANATISIVQWQKVWASNIVHMNDSEEDNHGISLIYQYLRNHCHGKKGNELKYLEEFTQRFSRGSDGVSRKFRYAFCVSEKPDLLSQWRGYTPKGGYSIGIGSQELKEIARLNGLSLDKCLYEEREQMAAIEEFFKPLFAQYTDWNVSQTIAWQRMSILDDASNHIRSIIKHPSFAEECEWRMHGSISATDDRCKVRAVGPYLRPYAELSLVPGDEDALTPIKEIYTGPGLEHARAAEALRILFYKAKEYRTIDIKHSACPYRT